jgi:hypothetical protein
LHSCFRARGFYLPAPSTGANVGRMFQRVASGTPYYRIPTANYYWISRTRIVLSALEI